jgi:hypothetical protein
VADHSCRGVLPAVVCLECGLDVFIMRESWPARGCCAIGNTVFIRDVVNVACSLQGRELHLYRQYTYSACGSHHFSLFTRVRLLTGM